MKIAVSMIVVVMLSVGCGGETRQMTTFKLGPDGKPNVSTVTERDVTSEEAIEIRKQAIHDGVAYVGSCTGGSEADMTAYGNEYVFSDTLEFGQGECTFAGGGSSVVWFLSLDDPWAKFQPSNRSMNNLVRHYRIKANDFATQTRVAIHLNEQFGGGTHTDTWIQQGQSVSFADFSFDPVGSSVLLCATPQCVP